MIHVILRKVCYTFILLLILVSCRNDYPDSIWPPKSDTGPQPEITAITPAGSSFAGVGNLTLSGKNFAAIEPYDENNQVVFDNVWTDILNVTPTEIVVRSPVLVKDSILVKVWSRGYPDYSDTFHYTLKAAVELISDLDTEKDIITAMAMDKEENLYVHVREEFNTIIKQVKPSGESIEFAKVTFINANGMKYGPDGKIYVCVSQGRINQIKTVDASGTEATFAPLAVLPQDLDFDQQGRIWLVARKSTLDIKPSVIVRVDTDGSTQSFSELDYYFSAVRIFEQAGTTYVYVSGRDGDEQMVWRFPIQGDGTLGAAEIILDSKTDTWLHGTNILTMTISSSGKIYLGTESSPDAIFIYDPQSGSNQALYPDLIRPDLIYLTWGNGNFLYASQRPIEFGADEDEISAQILKIGLDETSAPYYGRQ